MGHKNGVLHITWNTPQKNVEKFTKLYYENRFQKP